jgi:hypothetical protein
MKLFNAIAFLVLVAALVGFFAANAAAQSLVSGEVDGTVVDSTGAVVPSASVNLSSTETGFNETTTTGSTGTFRFALVKPGKYNLTVTQSGFATVKNTVTVSLGQVTEVPVKLEVSSKVESIEITTSAPLLQTENANLATTVDRQSIEMVPSPGQDITNYALTTPGVTVSTGAGYGNFTANGLPGTANLYTVNGNDYNDPFNNLNNSGSSNLLLGSNELQEITIVTNGYTGEYGRAAGANVNYTTKSGTNQFHGNAGYWYNGTLLNANDFFANSTSPATQRPHAVSNQWVGSFGGPIIKDKLFFFYDNEGLRYVVPGGGPVWVPTDDFAAATLANIAVNGPGGSLPFYQNIFKLYAGAPGIGRATPIFGACGDLAGHTIGGVTFENGAGTPGIACAKTFQSTVNSLNKEWLQAFTVDWNATQRDNFRFRVKTDRGVQATGTDPINAAFDANSPQPEDDGQMVWTHVFGSTMTNQFIMAGLYYSAIFGPPNLAKALATFPSTISFADGAPFTNLGGGGNNGAGLGDSNYPQGRNVAQYQVIDDFSWTRGNHGIKFGINFRGNRISTWTAGVNTSGTIAMNSMTDFFYGVVSQTGATAFANGGDTYSQRFSNQTAQPESLYSLGFYIQDEWRMKPSLKFTFALRADSNSNEQCRRGCYARPAGPFSSMNHDITTPYSASILTGVHSFFPSVQAVAWGPRIGFAWTPNSKLWQPGSTVIRGGFGMFPQLYPGLLGDFFVTNPPYVVNYSVLGTIPTPISFDVPGNIREQAQNSNSVFQSLFSSGGTLAQMQAALPNFSKPTLNTIVGNVNNSMFYEWNLQVEHTFAKNNVISFDYVGNKGTNIFVRNQGLNAYCAPGRPGCPVGTLFNGDIPSVPTDPRFASVLQVENNGISNYNGLTASYTHRFSHGLTVNFNYNYSHALDDVSNGGLSQYNLSQTGNSLRVQVDPYNLRHLNYSNSDYDFRNSISANYYYLIPFKSSNQFVNAVAGGWSFGGTFYYRSAVPWSVRNSGVNSNITNGASMVGLADYLGGPTSCGAPNYSCPLASQFASTGSSQRDLGNVPRNFFRGPSYFNSDLNLQKDFHATERLIFSLGASAFNVFNHPNFDIPINNVHSSLFGQTFQTVTPPNSPYGNFQGATVSGRIVQVFGKFKF